jgi:anaerobic selenocysteine-containing dehydrogenase
MTDSLTRRQFLSYGGATLAGITLGEIGRRQLARADKLATEWRPRGDESWRTSICRECPAACGVRVRLLGGVPVKLEGNPLCPIGRGRLCAKGQAAIESYFDPDRFVAPARRAGARGENRWEALEWSAGIDLLAAHLRQAVPGGIVALSAEEHGPLADAWVHLWTAAGARLAVTPAPTARRLAASFAALTGASRDPIFDLAHATHVLSFAAPLVEDWLSPVWDQRAYGAFRRSGSRPRGRLVQIDERRSLTARKADEWLAVPAGQQPSLAYGLASILLREGRLDALFLEQFGGNRADFEREVSTRHAPDTVAARTGIPVVTLLRLARELATAPRPLVTVAADAERDLIDAVLALNALLGAFDRPGGISQAAVPTAGSPPQDASAWLRDLAGGSDRPALVLFRDASALRARSTPPAAAAALQRCDFVVSFSPYLDEAAAVADLLLPTHSPLESWHAVLPAPAGGAEAIALAAPVAADRLDTRDLFAVLGEMSAKVGDPLAATCTWASSKDLVDAELDRLFRLRRGCPYSHPFEIEWVRQLETGGWWVPSASTPEEFGTMVLEAGGWLDPYVPAGQVRQALRARGGLSFSLPIISAVAGVATQVHGSAWRGEAAGDGTLRLITFTPAVVNLIGGPNQPGLFELLGQPEGLPWSVWAELNPQTARAHGIAHGQRVRIESAAGSLEAIALHADGMPAESIALAYVPSVQGGGRWARLSAADARTLWEAPETARSCRVRVRRA